MNFEKKNNIYRIIMIILVTAFVTFLITMVGFYNYNKNLNNLSSSNTIKIDIDDELSAKLSVIKSYLEQEYIGEIKDDKMIESAIKGYVDGLEDQYTEYLTQSEYEELMIDVYGNYVGIGIYMAQYKTGEVVVLLPIENSPAEEAGLESGDIIVKVNGEECKDQDLELTANKIKGEEGTTVELEILRGEETLNKTITRRTVEINYIKSEMLENNIGYIKLIGFDDETVDKFRERYNELKQKGMKSLIIDVRDNGGGTVDSAIKIAEMMVPKDKVIMKTISKDQTEKVIKSSEKNIIDMDIVILSNENSASASEILVGALKDNEIAKVVGTKTFGKGVMQEIVPITGMGALKITIEEFRTPNGDIINEKGIEPDVVIEESENKDEDLQLKKAIELLK